MANQDKQQKATDEKRRMVREKRREGAREVRDLLLRGKDDEEQDVKKKALPSWARRAVDNATAKKSKPRADSGGRRKK